MAYEDRKSLKLNMCKLELIHNCREYTLVGTEDPFKSPAQPRNATGLFFETDKITGCTINAPIDCVYAIEQIP